MRILLFVISVLFLSLSANAAEQCDSLAPTNAQDVDETFKGSIEGELNGLIGRLAGANADIDGEYKNLVRDTLKDYPDSHKLYVWQRIIFLVCIKPNSGIDINKLLELYFSGPPTANVPPRVLPNKIQVAVSAVEAKVARGDPNGSDINKISISDVELWSRITLDEETTIDNFSLSIRVAPAFSKWKYEGGSIVEGSCQMIFERDKDEPFGDWLRAGLFSDTVRLNCSKFLSQKGVMTIRTDFKVGTIPNSNDDILSPPDLCLEVSTSEFTCVGFLRVAFGEKTESEIKCTGDKRPQMEICSAS